MLRLTTGLIAALIVTTTASDLFAWNAAGHRTIASIVWRRLSEERRAELAELLTHHPRYQPDFVESFPDSVKDADPMVRGEWLLQHASVWPDIAYGQIIGTMAKVLQWLVWAFFETPNLDRK